MFVVLAFGYVFSRTRAISRSVPRGPGQMVGIDLSVVSVWTIQNPMFWVVFICMAVIGSEIVGFWKR